MPAGTINDPKLNEFEKDYGILTDGLTGHKYLYLKDETSRYLTHGTPIDFVIKTAKVKLDNLTGREFEIECAIIKSALTIPDSNDAASKFNAYAQAPTTEWTGKLTYNELQDPKRKFKFENLMSI